MPVEHEYKFILSKDILKDPGFQVKPMEIEQGYLAKGPGMSLRVRSVKRQPRSAEDFYRDPDWYVTLKQKVGDKTVEIENSISTEDGESLWTKCTGKLKKLRYVYEDYSTQEDNRWELDVFMDGDEIYFIMAEVELAFGKPRPPASFFIAPYVIYEVDLTDERFSNKNLGDVEFAKQLYQELQTKKEADNGHNNKEKQENVQSDQEESGC